MKELFEKYETPHRFIPTLGDSIDGYAIISELGEGAFGKVYKVRSPEGAMVALKLVKLWEVAFEKDRKAILDRFIREFQISSISSKYLVKSHAYGKILGNPYFVMEFCEGGSLENWCGRFATNKNYEVIAYDILKGLHELHTRGYFHRDIKPANILLGRRDTTNAAADGHMHAKLADFGIAGEIGSKLTVKNIFGKPDQMFGTWAYMAPEQENNGFGRVFRAINHLSDIFSFGVTMFELFTGELPFPPYKIESQSELVEYRTNLKQGNYRNLHNKKREIPANWLAIIEGCLQLDFQKHRFQSIDQIIVRLGYSSMIAPLSSGQRNPGRFALQITYGEELNKMYDFSQLLKGVSGNTLTLGRKDNYVRNNIEIAETQTTYISRRHATLEKWDDPDCWRIRDGQWTPDGWAPSVNGLFVNSRQVGIGGIRIEPGDIITMGDTILKIMTN